MSSQPIRESREWLTLGNASKQLGVSPATLRQWADAGKIRSFRTPGGHRRFSISQMQSMVASRPSSHSTRPIELLIHSALGRARLEIASGRLDHAEWHRHLSVSAREQHREIGQRLMSLLLQSLRDEKPDANLLTQVSNLGKEYARISVDHGIGLSDSLRAFLFFHDYVIEGLIELAESKDTAGMDVVDIYRRLNQMVNEMLLTMIDNYAGAKKRR